MKGPSVMQSVKCKVCSKLADLPPPVDLPVDLNGNLRFLLLEFIWADQLADIPSSDLPVDLKGNF